ncbi:hypothetical protein ES703_98992 [subsurface metagenome]
MVRVGKMNEKLEKTRNPEEVIIVTPKYAPSTPPKNYKKKKAISIFCCIKYSYGFKCPELLRARITTKGDVYIVPYPITETGSKDLHLSHHSSGEFHWTDDVNHVQPIYGEDDFPTALKIWLKFKRPPCFCFRKGKALNDIEIDNILQRIARYLPFSFNIKETYQNLKDANFYRLALSQFKRSKV